MIIVATTGLMALPAPLVEMRELMGATPCLGPAHIRKMWNMLLAPFSLGSLASIHQASLTLVTLTAP